MNTSKLANISEIVSSIAIAVTLVFLTIQVNQNTQSTQAATRCQRRSKIPPLAGAKIHHLCVAEGYP